MPLGAGRAAVAAGADRRLGRHAGADVARDLDQARAPVGFEPVAADLVDRRRGVDGIGRGAVGVAQRRADAAQLGQPLAPGDAEAAVGELLERALQPGLDLRPVVAPAAADGVDLLVAVDVGQREQVGAAHRRAGHRHARADVVGDRHDRGAAAGFEIDHRMAVAAAQRRRGVERVRELLERLTRGAADVHAGDRGIAQRQHRGAQLVFAEAANVVEVAELGQRVGEAGHGRLGQAGAMGDLLVAQHAFAGMEGAQDVEAAGQRGDELAVLAAAFLGEAILDGALEGGGSRDEMTDIAHCVYSYEWPFISLRREIAIAPAVPQCARRGFDLRTCKTAMSQMRELLSQVVKARFIARIQAFSHPICCP